MGFLLGLVGIEVVQKAFSEDPPRVAFGGWANQGGEFRVASLGWIGACPSNPD